MAATFIVKSLLITLFVMGFSLSAQAASLMNGQRFIESCKQSVASDNDELSPCATFIYGYLSASPYVVSHRTMPEGIGLRAFETRAPSRNSAIKSIKQAQYCVAFPLDKAVTEIEIKVAELDLVTGNELPETLLKNVLDSHFSCPE
ncbi:hypothetical protein [Neptunicella marina]|uniref:Rap1a immunity protein domain-containing protein n=1 Tax=Neptunicella marina TaxID=2125989 RepID=A0A8J6ISJ5_9ALTE|nr:hypothetical protein [Neptunicella marina]MBC3765509.1 hypothetical protein [Neptunicella marina]